jgi:hypothetical protein
MSLPVYFRLSLDERVRAMAGPPAYIRRRKQIEDLEELIVVTMREALVDPRHPDSVALRRRAERQHAKLVELVDKHNTYYPMEANLPLDVRTGIVLERSGVPWKPLRSPSLEELEARARETL